MNIFAKKIQLKSVDWIFDLRHLQEILTVRVTILSNSIAGAMWKSNTKYWWKKMNNLSTLPLITETMIEEFNFFQHFTSIFMKENFSAISANEILELQQWYLEPTSLQYGQLVDSLTLVYFFWSPTCTQTTGSMLSPASCRASITVIHTLNYVQNIQLFYTRNQFFVACKKYL